MSYDEYTDPNYSVVPVPEDPTEKLIDALWRCLMLLEVHGVSKVKELRGYQVDYVIRLAKNALRTAHKLQQVEERLDKE